eukprot:TRINITY_DN13579_c0_g1_i1.p1 TRINITY_DN13579_c0_g1~~TRINITY_DN13579_c0_g1_i1.p1  ORF type:complete len:191 (+),score=46.50 TRINITY_DN13579_c0_g1_i1:61-573(+)
MSASPPPPPPSASFAASVSHGHSVASGEGAGGQMAGACDRAWRREVQKCAGMLRRVYEQVGQQKGVMSRHCVHLLGDLVTAVAADGHHRHHISSFLSHRTLLQGSSTSSSGLLSDVEGALKLAAFALLEATTDADLQHLHAILGPGSLRRGVLAAYKREYELRHKFSGKV